MHRPQDKFKVKKKIKINSLQAAICNVALFKSMKDKDFRDTIFISYCEEGVILEAISEAEWKRAHDHIQFFLENKKIELLIDGFDKDAYEALINKGLKQITRKIRQSDQQCPYINIIHYQKLRKSCEYMDKQKYIEPLKDWQRKNKKNHNFAFLIVQPKHRFDQIKRCLLQHLLNQQITIKCHTIQPIQLLHLLFFSPNKQAIRTNCHRRQIEISVQKNERGGLEIRVVNFTQLKLDQYCYSIIGGESKIGKVGVSFQVIGIAEIQNQVKNCKIYCKDNPTELVEKSLAKLEEQYGENFMIVPYKKEEQEKFKALIQKFTNRKLSKEEIDKRIEMHRSFSEDQIEYLEEMYVTKNLRCMKVCVNNSPYMVHEHKAANMEMDSFVMYLEQLQMYECTFLVRYYGLAIKYKRDSLTTNEVASYLLLFDYHESNLMHMIDNDMILDSMQIASMMLQVLYLVNFLHSQDQPRCLGPIEARDIFWPMAITLPYLGVNEQQPMYSIENDIKQVGQLMKEIMGEDDDEDLQQIVGKMTNPNKYQRPTAKKCIVELEDLLCL